MYLSLSHVPILCNLMDSNPPESSIHGDSPGKNTGVGCHALLQGSSQPKDWTQVFHIAGGFFIVWATREALIFYYVTTFHELKLWKMALTGVIWHKNNVPQKVCRSCICYWIWNTLTLRSRRWHYPNQVDCWLKLLWFLVRETELKIS